MDPFANDMRKSKTGPLFSSNPDIINNQTDAQKDVLLTIQQLYGKQLSFDSITVLKNKNKNKSFTLQPIY